MIQTGRVVVLLGRPRLPGDILVRRGGFTLMVPLLASIVASVVLTLLFNLLLRLR